MATLTYVYADSTAVLGPLATEAEPHTYDLCAQHALRLTAPRGWEVVRLTGSEAERVPADDIAALADAVRRAGTRPALPVAMAAPEGRGPGLGAPQGEGRGEGAPGTRRGHLRVLRDDPL